MISPSIAPSERSSNPDGVSIRMVGGGDMRASCERKGNQDRLLRGLESFQVVHLADRP